MGELRSKMVTALRQRNYSEMTIKTYISACKRFAKYYNKDPRHLGNEDIQKYLEHLTEIRQTSWSLHRQTIAGLRFLYREVLDRKWEVEKLPVPRKSPRKPPVYLTDKEVKKFFRAIKNPKHLIMLETIYATGMRNLELISLKVQDIDSEQKLIFIRRGKGGKSRYTLLPNKLLKKLRIYWLEYRPKEWLFEGRKGHISSAVLQKACKQACQNSGITKNITPRVLRHSFATKLHEEGESLITIARLLGHADIKTTEFYTHVSLKKLKKTKSPLEYLK